MSDSFPSDLRYTKDHEWTKGSGSEVTVGITAFAVEQLGDITLVNIDVKPGDTVTEGKSFGTIESVKTLSDLFAPVSGKVVRVNADLEGKPELVNEDCWKAWMIAIAPADGAAVDALMDAEVCRSREGVGALKEQGIMFGKNALWARCRGHLCRRLRPAASVNKNEGDSCTETNDCGGDLNCQPITGRQGSYCCPTPAASSSHTNCHGSS